jgi:hypothetical protein
MCDFGGTTRMLCTKEDCKICFEASFASSKRADSWSKKNEKIARQVFKGHLLVDKKLINLDNLIKLSIFLYKESNIKNKLYILLSNEGFLLA